MAAIDPAADLELIFDGSDFTPSTVTLRQGTAADAGVRGLLSFDGNLSDLDGLDEESARLFLPSADLTVITELRPGATAEIAGDANRWNVVAATKQALGAAWLLGLRRRRTRTG